MRENVIRVKFVISLYIYLDLCVEVGMSDRIWTGRRWVWIGMSVRFTNCRGDREVGKVVGWHLIPRHGLSHFVVSGSSGQGILYPNDI